MIDTTAWKMGHYPMGKEKAKSVEQALVTLEMFNHKHEVAIIREAFASIAALANLVGQEDA